MTPYQSKDGINVAIFTNKISTIDEYVLATNKNQSKPIENVKKKKIKAHFGDTVLVKSSKISSSDPVDSAINMLGKVIDIAPFGGNGGFFFNNKNKWTRDQDPIYRIKLNVPHNFYIQGIITDDVVVYGHEIKTSQC